MREKEILSPANTIPGDVLVGFPSSGFHSNGYSLIRKVIADQALDLDEEHAFGGRTRALKEWLMEPTRLYVDVIRAIRTHDIDVLSLAHITGGGYFENLPRSLSAACDAVLRSEAFDTPHGELFTWFAETAGMTRPEMLATFNGGYGLVAVCRPAAVDAIQEQFPDARIVGEVVAQESERVVLV